MHEIFEPHSGTDYWTGPNFPNTTIASSAACRVVVATGPSDAGQLVLGLCYTVPKPDVMNMGASELCGRSSVRLHGAGR